VEDGEERVDRVDRVWVVWVEDGEEWVDRVWVVWVWVGQVDGDLQHPSRHPPLVSAVQLCGLRRNTYQIPDFPTENDSIR
jgi:hypothetical protein